MNRQLRLMMRIITYSIILLAGWNVHRDLTGRSAEAYAEPTSGSHRPTVRASAQSRIASSVGRDDAPGEMQTRLNSGRVQYHLSVLLDLSDRIRSDIQVEKDKRIIRGIVSLFEQEVKRKLYINSRDRLNIIIAPQQNNYADAISEGADILSIDMSRMNPSEKREFLPKRTERLLTAVDDLYRVAAENPHFTGADIWSFFRTHLEGYIGQSTSVDNVRNVLIILTDGYIDFSDSVQRLRPKAQNRTSYMQASQFAGDLGAFDLGDHGLISFKRDFGNLEVLVLEITERRVGDEQIINKYWEKWFNEMGIQRYDFRVTHDSTAQVESLIRKFIFSRDSGHP